MSDEESFQQPFHRPKVTTSSASTERYFFDIEDGGRFVRDDIGIELNSVDIVAEEAYNLLRGLVQDRLPEGRSRMIVRVRNASGTIVYSGEMTIDGRRGGP